MLNYVFLIFIEIAINIIYKYTYALNVLIIVSLDLHIAFYYLNEFFNISFSPNIAPLVINVITILYLLLIFYDNSTSPAIIKYTVLDSSFS